ncbi:MAG: VanW family protein [Bacillaceae bacterium]|nr:VanW family protein [Bacillaceae bacterium]
MSRTKQFHSSVFLNEHSLNSPNDEISIVASVLYNVLMHTNFDILERHISQSLPSYSELGFEAFVSYPHHDLRFTNPNYVPYTVTAEIDSHVLKISLVGDPLEYRYEVKLLEEQTFSPKTIVHFSEELEPGRFRIEFVGEKGFAAMVMREEYTNESTLVRSILLSEDFYRPVHQIVVQSIKDKPESTDDSGVSPIPGFIDPNDQDNQDDNIDKGIEEDDEKIKGYY